MKTNLKVGDKVKVYGYVSGYKFTDEIGVIAKIDGDGTNDRDIGVDFGSSFNGHKLNGAIKSPTGLWVSATNCTVIEEKPKHKFKVGDRVICNGFLNGHMFNNDIGTVKAVEGKSVGVVFDEDFGGHTLGNRCSRGHGWLINSELNGIQHYNRQEKIVIYRTGNKVVAKDTITGKECYSRCHPDDEFDFNIGAKLAFDRLVGNVEPKSEPKPKYYNGKVVCVDGFTVLTTKGKIYEFVDGLITFDNGDESMGRRMVSIEDINRSFESKFIEVVE